MYFNAQVGELLHANSETNSTTESTNESTPLLNNKNIILKKKIQTGANDQDSQWNIESRHRYGSVTEEGSVDEDNWVESNIFFKVLMFPAMLVFKLTLPKPTKYCFVLTFAISIVWISVLTYAAVWLVTIIGMLYVRLILLSFNN